MQPISDDYNSSNTSVANPINVANTTTITSNPGTTNTTSDDGSDDFLEQNTAPPNMETDDSFAETTTSPSTGFSPVIAYIMMGVIVLLVSAIGYLFFILKRANAKGNVKTQSGPIELLKA
jgi:hypothetical protein